MSTPPKSDLFSELLRRRVVQIVGLFLAGAWVALEFSGWLVERYGLSDRIIDAILFAALALLPAVILLAWNHGAKGKDEWTKAERFAVPANVLIAAGICVTVLVAEPTESLAETVTVTNEEGENETFTRARAGYTKSVLIYFFPTGSDETPEYLSYATPFLVSQDLGQSIFVQPHTVYTNGEWGLVTRLQRAGFADQIELPLSFQRELAVDQKMEYFVRGSVEKRADELWVSAQIYKSESAQLHASFELEGRTPFDVADQLSLLVRQNIGLPEAAIDQSPDLPIAELTTSSEAALQKYIEGINARILDNDFAAAGAALREARTIDETFAVALANEGWVRSTQGRIDEAIDLLKRSQKHSYRLLQAEQFFVKAGLFSLNNDRESEAALFRMWTEIEPNNLSAWISLANSLRWGVRDLSGAADAYQKAAEISFDDWLVSSEAELRFAIGDTDRAIANMTRYVEHEPENHSPLVYRGMMYMDVGDLEGAEKDFARARLLRSDVVSPRIHASTIALRRGNIDKAAEWVEAAEQIAASQSQKTLVVAARAEVLMQSGRQEELLRELQNLYASAKTHRDPTSAIVVYLLGGLTEFGFAGEAERALDWLDSETEVLSENRDLVRAQGRSILLAAAGDVAGASAALETVATAPRDGLSIYLMPRLFEATAMAQFARGEYLAAAESYLKAEEEQRKVGTEALFANDRIRILSRRARALRRAGSLDDAKNAVELALTLGPRAPSALLERALISAEAGDIDSARRNAQGALDIWNNADSGFAPAIEAQALLESLAALSYPAAKSFAYNASISSSE